MQYIEREVTLYIESKIKDIEVEDTLYIEDEDTVY